MAGTLRLRTRARRHQILLCARAHVTWCSWTRRVCKRARLSLTLSVALAPISHLHRWLSHFAFSPTFLPSPFSLGLHTPASPGPITSSLGQSKPPPPHHLDYPQVVTMSRFPSRSHKSERRTAAERREQRQRKLRFRREAVPIHFTITDTMILETLATTPANAAQRAPASPPATAGISTRETSVDVWRRRAEARRLVQEANQLQAQLELEARLVAELLARVESAVDAAGETQPQPQVQPIEPMFTLEAALAIYKDMRARRFPLDTPKAKRY